MATINSFEDLKVWQKARILNQQIYEIIQYEKFASDYKLKNQINGAGGSVMDNIAEGFGRNGKLEFINFLSISHGSTMEIKSQLYRAADRFYITKEKFDELEFIIDEISKMLNAFINYLKQNDFRGLKFKNRVD